MTWPRISVVTPSFNQGRFLRQALASVLDQGYPNLEYIVLDGGSTDDSVRILESFADRLTFWASERDDGQADAIASGFRRSTGDILAWLNSDDVLLPGSLDRIAREFVDHPDYGLVYGARDYIDENGVRTSSFFPPSILGRWYFSLGQWIPQECAFWRRSLYEKAGGMDPSLFFALDFSLFVRMWGRARFKRIPAKLGAMRRHPGTKTSTAPHVMSSEGDRIRAENGVPLLRSRHPRVARMMELALYAQGAAEWTWHDVLSRLGLQRG